MTLHRLNKSTKANIALCNWIEQRLVFIFHNSSAKMAKWTLATQVLSTIGQQNVRMFSRTGCLASQAADYYETLGVLKNAKQREIREAYESIAKMHHPSNKLSNPKRLQEAKEAFAVLGNIENRRLFDQGLSVFDIKSSIPKDDRIQHFKGIWEAEPRKTTMASSKDRAYENYQFTISRTHEQVGNPDEKIQDEITNFGFWLVIVIGVLHLVGLLNDEIWRWGVNQEMNEKQRKAAKNA